MRHRWADGTTHLEWDPVDFLGRLAVLVPRPRINLVLYHGVLAPRAAWRSAVVRRTTSEEGDRAESTAAPGAPRSPLETPAETLEMARDPTRNRLWADLMRRTFRFDVLACPRCGGRLRLIALIEQVAVIECILRPSNDAPGACLLFATRHNRCVSVANPRCCLGAEPRAGLRTGVMLTPRWP